MLELQVQDQNDATVGDDEALRCARCQVQWAQADAVVPASRKAYMNPHGLVRDIVVVSAVTNLAGDGERHATFSWFPGHTWEVHVCAGCGALAGWRFEGPSTFWGLLVEAMA